MGDFEAPSFSLGFDFDFHDTPEPQTTPNNTSNRDSVDVPVVADVKTVVDGNDNDNDEEFDTDTLTVADSDDGESEVEVRPRLKRLRRGLSGSATVDLGSVVVDDDDIEDFSSPEDDNAKDDILPTQHYSVSNSSKFPLTGLGVLTREPGKRKQNISYVSNVPESVITSCSKQPLPKLTVSPLRKFQLIDSDSDFDIPSISKVATNKTCTKSEPYLNREQYAGLNQPRKLSESLDTSARKELWEDFRHEKSFHILTPALDEVCDEYFSSMKDKKKALSNVGKSNHNSHVMDSVIDLDDPRLPAHQYFFHNDLRIQELVRIRLCNFSPLNDRGSEQPSTSNIDYMGQFSNGDKTKQAARSNKAETSSLRKNLRKSKTQETSQGFMIPKVNTATRITKDAGKRRVQADGQATGHWFINGDGKRVYVAKNGQEMTGKAAYIHYKKESGGGFKNKKAKKTSTKKK